MPSRRISIEVLKASLLAKGLSRKRVNSIRACLGKMLRYTHEVELLEVVPRVELLKIPPQKFDFPAFDELSRLIEGEEIDPERPKVVCSSTRLPTQNMIFSSIQIRDHEAPSENGGMHTECHPEKHVRSRVTAGARLSNKRMERFLCATPTQWLRVATSPTRAR